MYLYTAKYWRLLWNCVSDLQGWDTIASRHKSNGTLCFLLSGPPNIIISLSSQHIYLPFPYLVVLHLHCISNRFHRLHIPIISYIRHSHSLFIMPVTAWVLVMLFNHHYFYIPVPGSRQLRGIGPINSVYISISGDDEHSKEAVCQFSPLSKLTPPPPPPPEYLQPHLKLPPL